MCQSSDFSTIFAENDNGGLFSFDTTHSLVKCLTAYQKVSSIHMNRNGNLVVT